MYKTIPVSLSLFLLAFLSLSLSSIQSMAKHDLIFVFEDILAFIENKDQAMFWHDMNRAETATRKGTQNQRYKDTSKIFSQHLVFLSPWFDRAALESPNFR